MYMFARAPAYLIVLIGFAVRRGRIKHIKGHTKLEMFLEYIQKRNVSKEMFVIENSKIGDFLETEFVCRVFTKFYSKF